MSVAFLLPFLILLCAALFIPFAMMYKHREGSQYESAVECSSGHIYTSIWIPAVSFKAVRLGRKRFQRCPVGSHWAMTVRIPDESLTQEQRTQAALNRDLRIP